MQTGLSPKGKRHEYTSIRKPNIQPGENKMNDYQFGVIIGSLVVGLICGAIPLVIGINKKKLGLGIGGLIACVVSGLIFGLILAIPICILFVWLISRASKKTRK